MVAKILDPTSLPFDIRVALKIDLQDHYAIHMPLVRSAKKQWIAMRRGRRQSPADDKNSILSGQKYQLKTVRIFST
jgi:hypothetical protein